MNRSVIAFRLLAIVLLTGALCAAADVDNALPTLRLINYRGPGNGDRDSAPAICDGDAKTEWLAIGLSKTTLGPPFEFEFEFLDGAEHELSGIRLASAAAVTGWQAREFEIRLQAEGQETYDRVLYRGAQKSGGESQTHLFETPERVRRFMFKLLSNHGDPDNAQINELWPVFNADETAAARAPGDAKSTALPMAMPKPPAPKYAGKFPYSGLTATAPPVVKDSSAVANSLDRFVLSTLEAKGLSFAPQVAKDLLLRRVTYDLTGLPPTLQERAAFLADTDPHAYETVVDRLLASPRFGEHWAQHWLDLVRYADTDGYAANGVRQGAWRYRDYVVAAFNNDKPYDRFVMEQLAADEMDNVPLDTLPALSFCRLGPFRANSGNQNLDRNRQEFMVEVTGAVSTTFLGLTVGCARCHDHKIDPIPQADYYRMQAFFEATEPATLPMASAAEQNQWHEQSAKVQKTLAALEAQRQALLKPARERAQKKLATMPSDKEVQGALSVDERRELNALLRKQKTVQGLLPPPLPPAWGIRDSGRVAPATFTLVRGEITLKEARVAPRAPGILPHADASESIAPVAAKSTGRRLALAKWLVGPGRAQTARIIVNRLWQQHFGRGIVATPSNFGGLGQPPTHPELLDWLAQDLIDGGWNLKRMHRMMVLSRSYQQVSEAPPEAVAKDETNALFSRFIRHRLTAEEIRDSALFHAGTLNLKMGGEGVVVPQPPEALVEIKKGGWRVTKDTSSYTERSIYLFAERKYHIPLLESFDQPDTMTACPERSHSTHVLQALGLLNNQWMIEQATGVADRLRREVANEEARVEQAYRMICGRDPGPKELSIARSYLADPEHTDALADYCHVLLNLNRFLYVD